MLEKYGTIMGWECGSVAESLGSMCEVLGSIPSTEIDKIINIL
jgi:hypothetical protein